jgi:hypothetical protein
MLGNGSTANSNVPVVVPGLGGVTALDAGQELSCAIVSGGNVACWGRADFVNGGASDDIAAPTLVPGLP